MTLGLKWAGYDVVGAVEIDSFAVTAYKANHPTVRVWADDIRNVDANELRRELGLRQGQLELLAGCPPCQGFSSMRTLNGARLVSDPRNDLVREFTRFVETLMPKMVIFENVPALAKDDRFMELRQKLTELRYAYEFRILNAAQYEVPQRRRRLFLVASRVGSVIFPEASKQTKTVRDVIASLPSPNECNDPMHKVTPRRSDRIMQLIRKIPKDGGSRSALGEAAQLDCHQRSDGFKDVYGRMAWDKVAPTITSGCLNPSKGRFLHPDQDRPITLREAAILQGFPSMYEFPSSGGRYAVAALIGNAVPPLLVQRVAVSLYSAPSPR